MDIVNAGGPPAPPFRHYRGRRRGGGFWGRFAAAGIGMQLNIGLSLLGLLLIIGYLVWRFILPSRAAAEDKPVEPTVTMIQTVGPLPTPVPAVAPLEPIQLTATAQALVISTPDPDQIAKTATFQAAINRPAANPNTSPAYIGVITYEPGCDVSNLGFTTAGYEGKAFYLYFQALLDRDPFMQMVQVRGYVQQFKNCQYPVLMVTETFWLNGTATPAPVAVITSTITGTTPITWGVLPTPTNRDNPVYDARLDPSSIYYTGVITSTVTPYPTYTPYPTATPYIPPQRNDSYNEPEPTDTPKPTKTPTPTITPTPTQAANLAGQVVSISGCAATNLAIQVGQGQTIPLLLYGAPMPPNGTPIGYYVMASGALATICGQPGLMATSVSWYTLPTATSTLVPTVTDTPTITPTSTETATSTPTSTETPTETATSAPTSTETPTEVPTATETSVP